MSEVLGYIVLALAAAFWTYRQVCILSYQRACRRAAGRRPFKGVRLRIALTRPRRAERIPTLKEIERFLEDNGPLGQVHSDPPRSTNGHQLRLVASHQRRVH